jgi:hypothetical protein
VGVLAASLPMAVDGEDLVIVVAVADRLVAAVVAAG